MPPKRGSSKRKTVVQGSNSTKSKSITTFSTASTTTSTTSLATTSTTVATEKINKPPQTQSESKVEENNARQHAFLLESSHLVDRPLKRFRSEDNKLYYEKFVKETTLLRREKTYPAYMDAIFSSFENFSLEAFDPGFNAIFNKKSDKSMISNKSKISNSSHISREIKKELSHSSESSTEQTKTYTATDSNHTESSGLSSSKSSELLSSNEFLFYRRSSLDLLSVASELSPVDVSDGVIELADLEAGSFSVSSTTVIDHETSSNKPSGRTDTSSISEDQDFSATDTTTTISRNDNRDKRDTRDTESHALKNVATESRATHRMTLRKRK
ncbi:hypothetical protein BDF20DRAFT_909898 [Mycotypha africana]|uniref:uncharacterized protein n=1 Tax=Mycotypha africana TaxID=64632 RepID=UPI0022FFCBA5|nr:uncharacterized protein BDF20DRAFT_909898 [Mycotypha africana]KAI8987258.1 hypothetical protein BDF20DRAFT_909898 [Mycotypha africana]